MLLTDDGRLQAQWQGQLQAPEVSNAQVDLKLPHLQALAPWARLLPALSAWAPQAGQLEAQARLTPSSTGSSPNHAAAWQGQAKLTGLQAGALKLRSSVNGLTPMYVACSCEVSPSGHFNNSAPYAVTSGANGIALPLRNSAFV